MKFSDPKKPRSAAEELQRLSMSDIKPHTPMFAPVYVYMKRNEKFIAVKAPLDFFNQKDFEKLRVFESFYVTKFVDKLEPFQNAASSVKAILSWIPPAKGGAGQKKYPEVALSAMPFEISDAVIEAIGPLWSPRGEIEPFFISVFANALCKALDPKDIEKVREQDYDLYERGVLASSWAVFLGLHLGFCDLNFLCQLRDNAFRSVTGLRKSVSNFHETEELIDLCAKLISSNDLRSIRLDVFSGMVERVSLKLAGRMIRVKEKLIKEDVKMPSIYGDEGFANGV